MLNLQMKYKCLINSYMARKNKIEDNRPFCDECKFAEWHTQEWNINWEGEPITFGCTKGVFEHG